jgi:small GTP-binding protein domain
MQQEQGGRARMRNKKSRRNALRTLRRRDTVGLLLLGKCEAGKSALLHRWMKGHFSEQYKPTVEDFHVKPYKHMGQCVNVGVIDMTGSWDFPAMMDLYLSRIDSVMFVYDIGSTDAVTDLRQLHERLVKVRGERSNVVLSVVGTKIDRHQDHYDDYRNDEIDKFLRSIDLSEQKHIMTSAKLNLNVSEAFESALNEVIENMIPNEDAIKRLGKLMKKDKTNNWLIQKFCCCRIF